MSRPLAPCGTPCATCATPMTPRSSQTAGARVHGSHGLCGPCERRARRTDTIADHPRSARSRVDVVSDYWLLIESRACLTRAQVADRIGISLGALDRALYRAGVDVAAVPRTGARPAGWGRR